MRRDLFRNYKTTLPLADAKYYIGCIVDDMGRTRGQWVMRFDGYIRYKLGALVEKAESMEGLRYAMAEGYGLSVEPADRWASAIEW